MIENENRPDDEYTTKFLCLGLGGGASHVIARFNKSLLNKSLNQFLSRFYMDFVIVDTDYHQLQQHDVPDKHKLRLGSHQGSEPLTPEAVRQSVEQSEADIRALLDGYERLFIVVGLGGSTGTVSAPMVARIAKDMGLFCTAVVAIPFSFEGKDRLQIAQNGLTALSQCVDGIISIDPDKLIEMYGNLPFEELQHHLNDISCNAMYTICLSLDDLRYIGIDYNDVRVALTGHGHVGFGRAGGEYRATKATQTAISSPLLNGINFKNVHGLFVDVKGDEITQDEADKISQLIESVVKDDCHVFYSCIGDENMGDEMMITVVAFQPFDTP